MVITHLYVEGLRTLSRLRLELGGLHVLIGKSGSGKSSLIEACEILRRSAGESFLSELQEVHGGLPALLRQGANRLCMSVGVQTEAGPAEYGFTLVPVGSFAEVAEEHLYLGPLGESPRPLRIIHREGGSARLFDTREGRSVDAQDLIGEVDGRHLILPRLRLIRPKRGTREVFDALTRIQVHLPFEVMPGWAARALDRKSALRAGVLIDRCEALGKLGANLANAYHALRNDFDRDHWNQTLEYARLGLGDQLEDIALEPWGEGRIALRLKYRALDTPVSAAQLSDGTLCFLGFLALYRLSEPPRTPSLLAFDEPDLHLHPELLLRVLQFMEDLASRTSVLLATHSDRLLDGLADPVSAAQLCELNERMETVIYRPDAERLPLWLERYRGLGTLRAEGFEGEIMNQQASDGYPLHDPRTFMRGPGCAQ